MSNTLMIDRIIAGDPCKHFIVRLHLVSKYIVEHERAATKPRMCDEAPPFGHRSTYLTWLALQRHLSSANVCAQHNGIPCRWTSASVRFKPHPPKTHHESPEISDSRLFLARDIVNMLESGASALQKPGPARKMAPGRSEFGLVDIFHLLKIALAPKLHQ